jgi:hypothetical protein
MALNCPIEGIIDFFKLMPKFQQALRKIIAKNVSLSIDIEDPMAIPYFLRDEPMSIAQLKERHHGASQQERIYLLGYAYEHCLRVCDRAFLFPEIEKRVGRRHRLLSAKDKSLAGLAWQFPRGCKRKWDSLLNGRVAANDSSPACFKAGV